MSGRTPWLYEVLLRFYPRDFRERFSAGMRETFAEELREARARGTAAVLGLWAGALVRTPLLALEERAALRQAGRSRFAIGMDAWAQDVRFALRVLARAPGFVVVAVLTVSLGVGATASLFSVVNALLLRPLPVEAPERLVRVQELRSRTMSSGMEGPRIPWTRYRAIEEATRDVFAGLAAQNLRYLSMRADGPAFPVSVVLSSGNYFGVLGLRPAAGRFFGEDDEPVAVLGYRFWQQRFGGAPDVIGRTVHVSGQALTVVGVAPRGFGGTIGFLFADLWVPHGAHGSVAWPDAPVTPFGRLRAGVSIEAATPFVSRVTRRIVPDEDPGAEIQGVRLEPMAGTPASMAGAMRGFLGLLLATAFLVLLIGGANVAGMLLARAVSRRHEVAVRLALGVGRGRLVRQALLEAVLLFVLGGVGGMLVAVWAARLIARLRLPGAEPLLIDASPDARVLGFALAIAIVTGLFFGLLPALRASRAKVAHALRDGDRGASGRGARARDVFVAGQLALSVLLLIVSALFVRTLRQAMTLDPGFSTERVVVAATNLASHGYDAERGRAFYAQLLAGVRAHTDVESAALANVALLTGEHEVFGAWRTTPAGARMSAGQNIVDGAYFETLGFDLVAGRGIAATDVAGAPAVVVVNETFSRQMWPDANPIGRVVLRGDQPHEVVGVVRDGAYVEFGETPAPFAFLSSEQRYSARQVLHVRLRRGASAGALIDRIRGQVAALDADVAVEQGMPLSVAIEALLFPQRFGALLIGLFGAVGLLLAGIGVYGVLAHDVAQRAREFGIRIALGADARRLLAMVLRRGVLLATAGAVVGVACAAALTRFLRSFLHGVSPLDATAFAGVPLVLGVVALLASFLPALRTLRVDPVEALRRE